MGCWHPARARRRCGCDRQDRRGGSRRLRPVEAFGQGGPVEALSSGRRDRGRTVEAVGCPWSRPGGGAGRRGAVTRGGRGRLVRPGARGRGRGRSRAPGGPGVVVVGTPSPEGGRSYTFSPGPTARLGNPSDGVNCDGGGAPHRGRRGSTRGLRRIEAAARRGPTVIEVRGARGADCLRGEFFAAPRSVQREEGAEEFGLPLGRLAAQEQRAVPGLRRVREPALNHPQSRHDPPRARLLVGAQALPRPRRTRARTAGAPELASVMVPALGLLPRTPRLPSGTLRNKYFQRFTPELGHPKLKEHLIGVMALMRAAPNWEAFKRALQRSYPKQNE